MLKLVRRNKVAIDKLLFKVKKSIIKEGKKMALEYVMSQIPTEQQVIIKMEELIKENPQKAKKYYDETTKLLTGIKIKLESSLIKLDSMKSNLELANSQMTTISTINSIVLPLIDILEGIILGADVFIAGSGAVPGAPPGPTAVTATRKEVVKGKVKKLFSAIALAGRIIIIVSKTYYLLKRKVDDARAKVVNLITYIDNLLATLDSLFGDFIQSFLDGDFDNLSPLDDLNDLYSQNPGLEGYLNQDNTNFPSLDPEESSNTTDGISNIAPRFYKPYITGSTENSNTEE
tara:strand:+ start:1416 stop:2282 length:867 start_codon:yes stop_codon:yes gene_type:complete